jgi:hypothetical protein
MSNQFPLGSFENPVKCNDISGEHKYLGKLVGPGGIPIEYKRHGSRIGLTDKPVDIYEIRYKGLQEPIIVHMDMYAHSHYDKKAVDGLFLETDFLKTRDWQKKGYMEKVHQKEFGVVRIKYPDEYINIYTKAGILLAYGPYIYSKRDFFNLPMDNWATDELICCAEQVVHRLRGVLPSHPIEVNSRQTARHFMDTFHYKTNEGKIKPTNIEGVLSYTGKHVILDSKLQLFFRIKS